MKSNIRYVNCVFIGLGLAYIILSILNIFGHIQAKIILLCSIMSLIIAIVQILDLFISSSKISEINVLKTSLYILQVWYDENTNLDKKDIQKKIEEFNNDKNNIQKKYDNRIHKLCISSNIILTLSIIFFFIGISTDFLKENTILADTLTLFSFAIFFLSLAFNTKIDNYVEEFNQSLERIINIMEEKANGGKY